MIIGRKKETTLLSQILQSDNVEFLAVYGRRRIGKTYLMESFFRKEDCVLFHVTGIQNGLLAEHLKEFIKEIGQVFYGNAKIEMPDTWLQAFESLHKAMEYRKTEQPLVLFFDEFPWMATPRSRLLQALEYYWNRHWKNNKWIKLIICGSSASWIIKKIIRNKGGLHNRITHQMQLKPFNLVETKLFLLERKFKLNDQQIMDLYFVIGGIPHYLNQLQRQLSVAENINQLCFQRQGLLFEEFDRLFSSLFGEYEAYEELIRIIATSRHGISREMLEEKARLTKKGGTLTSRLKDLEMAGFIKAFLPIEHTKRGLYYRILDEYSLFYLQWIEPEKHNIELEILDNNFWLDLTKLPRYQSWRGYAFESVCYKHVGNIKKALNIRVAANIGTWRYIPRRDSNEQGTQIDLLFDRSDDAVTLCEIKYSDKVFALDKDYVEVLNKKLQVFRAVTRSKKQFFLCMVTVNGLKQNKHSQDLINAVVSIDHFFNE